MRKSKETKTFTIMFGAMLSLLVFTFLSGFILSSSYTSATTDDIPWHNNIDNVATTIPISCSIGGEGSNTHTASLINGTYSGASGSIYEDGIGKTTMTVFCNDTNGFAIYTIGFTGNTITGGNNNKLVGAVSNATINTGVYESGDTDSSWSMKVTKVENPVSGDPVAYNPENMTIASDTEGIFSSWHTVPAIYTKVAEYKAVSGSSTTDDEATGLGTKVETTYAAYISMAQTKDTYNGKVKYVLVHPYSAPAPAQPVTVTLDTNTTAVEFTNELYGTQTVTTSDSTVDLYPNVQYTITATFATDYELASWATGTNGTLGSTTTNPTTYTITGTSTLSVISQQEQASMQNFSCSLLNNVGDTITLTDSRDGEEYLVGKLADGNCWMLDNLRLDLTDSTVLNSLTTSNTNADSASLTSLRSGNRSAGDQYATAGFSGSNWTSGDSYSEPMINVSGTYNSNPYTKDSVVTSYGAGSGKIGIYYNYCAASAGSYCYGNGTSSGSPSGNASYDLCPAGWRMPTGGGSGEYQNLCTILNGGTVCTSSQSMPATNTSSLQYKFSTPLSGSFHTGSAYYQGNNGYFWSSTYYSSYSMYHLYVLSSGVFLTSSNSRNGGLSLRCLLGS